jgi:molecular chaperone HtpG
MTTEEKTAPGEESGSISVHTDNLFPIIKKWLYSEHDIFLRELVSNAVDACTKYSRLQGIGEIKGDLPAFQVNIAVNKSGKTLTISDNGVGMTREEVKKYINQIAFSGAQDFLEKFKDAGDGNQIIGHFGMGFFSAFMVADRVEIYTKSWVDGSDPVRWTCDGSTEFKMGPGPRSERGTDIILHLNAESQEFLDEERIRELVVRYSNFLPIEIQVNGKKANDQNAVWNQAPSKLKDEDYTGFFKKLYPMEPDPLFWVHFTVDFPFTLKGVLFFPKIRNDIDLRSKGRIRLFCNNVFVSDNIADLLPPYLNMLQGVLDSPDIPLNVSRSFLQGDPNVKKIGAHIVAKVAERLSLLQKNDRENYVKYWDDIHPFIKFGCLSDEKFYDKVQEALLFKTTTGERLTLREYQDKNTKLKDRVLYTSNAEAQHAYIDKFKALGVDIVVLDAPIDSHFIQHLEMKRHPLRFARVDSDTPEALLSEDKKEPESDKDFGEFIKKQLPKEGIEVQARPLAGNSMPSLIIQSEQMRRFTDMTSAYQGKPGDALLESHTLVVNTSHALGIRLKLWSTIPEKADDAKNLVRALYDLALLQQGALKGEELSNFLLQATQWVENGIKTP